ncbi:MAG TPA: DUF1800 family protein [Candidatus Acidoferrum sp.]|nr:DUF1800 family protein [Candidatus Acidoferrum sp.]
MKRSAMVLLSILLVFLGGCAEAIIPGNGSSQGYSVIVTPGSATLPGFTTQQFTAKTNDGSRPTLGWFVNGVAGGNATLGTISSAGLYTAPEFPPAPNTITVSATDNVDPTKTGSSAVTLNNPVPQLNSVTPTVIPIGPFTLSLTGAHFAPGATVFLGTTALTTTVISSTQLTATGTATDAEVGTVNITVQNPAPGANASSAISAQVKGIVVQVTPATGVIRAGNQQVFNATVTGATNIAVSWSVNGIAGGNATVGTIVSNGNYLAPTNIPTANTITVTATSMVDANASGNATITLGNPVPVLTSVMPTEMVVGIPFMLTLTGSGFMNGSVVNFGSQQLTTTFVSSTQLTASGTATAAQIGNVQISVTNPNPGSATSAAIAAQVVATSNIVVTVTPKAVTIGAGNTTQLLATVTGTTDTDVTWSVNNIPYGNNTVGGIDGDGNYTAPNNITTLGTVTVTATSVVDTTKSGSAIITLLNPVPTLTAITPGTLAPGSFQLTLYGTGFVSTSTATFGGQPMQVTYVTDTMITAIGSATAAQAGQVSVIVTNPVPGGGTSNGVSVTVTTAGTPVTATAAVRFLEQASFGPDMENVNQVEQLGFDTYLQNQFASTVTPYPNPRPKDSIDNVQQSFFLNSIAGGDQLRERVAMALNELWVVGADTVSDPLGYTNYLRTLDNDALGNYYNVMNDVTLTPAMGDFLNMVNNNAPAPGQHANENYAREIMQLFTLGLNQLNPDGTPMLDASGNPIPTYTQNDVMDLGRAFTGWTFPTQPGKAQQNNNPPYYGGPMIPVESEHDTGTKTILGQAMPAGQSAEQDLSTALGIIFNHPNVGPFVATQLIKKLVTSNPSPAYVQRVAQAFNTGSFNSYGTGKRGDLQATVAAILLDPEARRGDVAATSVATDGKLREPVIMIVSIARAFHAKTDAAGLSYEGDQMSQNIFYPPTVFNFFPPVNPIPQTTLNGPEFGIFNTDTSLARVNVINDAVYGALGSNTKLDFSPVINAGTPDQMIAWLDTLFLHSTTPDQMKQTILTAVAALDPSDTQGQAKAAIYLYTSSSMYQVQH